MTEEKKWNFNWVWRAYWDIFYFILLIVVVLLSQPHENYIQSLCTLTDEVFGEEGEDLLEMDTLSSGLEKNLDQTCDTSSPPSSPYSSALSEKIHFENENVNDEMKE